MAEEDQSPFVAGAKVALVSRGMFRDGYVSYREVTIGKVYASGNIKIEGDRQRYKPSRDNGEWVARQTPGCFGADRLELITDKLNGEVVASQARCEYEEMHDLISVYRKAPHHPSAELLSAMRALLAKIAEERR